MNKYYISAVIRKLGFIKFFDKLRFYILFCRTYRLKKEFHKKYPDAQLPPAYFIYETFNLNYFSFYVNGIETAKWLTNHFEKHATLKNLNILDWGCGPGRIIRHLPSIIDKSCTLHATDYNKEYVKWCKSNIQDVLFNQNQLTPPMTYEDNFFDIIYGISIFTHLSEEMHHKWFNELIRILKPNAILFLTTHGEAFKMKLTEAEKEKFDKGSLIVKSNTKEGHRTFGAFQPSNFMKNLIGKNKILEHIIGEVKNERPQQDIWIIRKK